jgi:hypothetical protein
MEGRFIQVFLDTLTGKIYELNPVSPGKELGNLSKNAPAPVDAPAPEKERITSWDKYMEKVERLQAEPFFSSSSIFDFEPFTWKKQSLLKNPRGDVITEDMKWFGHYDAKTNKVNTSAKKPDDLQFGGKRQKYLTRKYRK